MYLLIYSFPFMFSTCKSDSGLRAFSQNYRPPRGSDKIRALSGPSILPRPEDVLNNETEVRKTFLLICLFWINKTIFSFFNSFNQKNHSNFVQIHQLYHIHCRCQNMEAILRSWLNSCQISVYLSVDFIGEIDFLFLFLSSVVVKIKFSYWT